MLNGCVALPLAARVDGIGFSSFVLLKSLIGSSLEDPTMINDVSISVNCWPLSAKLASFMTRPIVDWSSELVFYKSQIGPGRKTGAQRGARGAKNNIWCDF